MSKLDILRPFYNEVKETFCGGKDVEVTSKSNGIIKRSLSRNNLRLIMYSIKHEKLETINIIVAYEGEKLFDEVVSKTELNDWLL